MPQKQNLTLPAAAGTSEPASNDGRTEENGRTNVMGNDKDRVLNLFQVSGESFELHDNRLKAKSGLDFVRRATYLFLYTNELQGKNSASNAEIKTMFQKAKCWDANTRAWLVNELVLRKKGRTATS